MTESKKRKINDILCKHLTNAIDEIDKQQLVYVWWPEDYVERFSTMIIQSLVFTEDSLGIERMH